VSFGVEGVAWDKVIQAIKEVGFPIVAYLLLAGGIGIAIAKAVEYFAKKLDVIVDYLTRMFTEVMGRQDRMFERIERQGDDSSRRNAQSLERIDDRLASMMDSQVEATTRLTEALNRIADSNREAASEMARLNESNHILITFTAQNMAEVRAHRNIVEPEPPPVGIVKPVEPR
jgi:methyl-accepting chemotaxis protein